MNFNTETMTADKSTLERNVNIVFFRSCGFEINFVGGKVLSKAHQFFRRPKHLSIPSPDFDYEIEHVSGKHLITVRSKSFLCQLHLISTKVRGVFSDNYFDMLPGEVLIIGFEPSENKELKKSDLRVRTLYEMMN